MTDGSLNDLLLVHRELDRLFLQHQVLLVQGDADGCRRVLWEFRAVLLAHMQAEEDLILPAYEARVVAPKGGEARYFKSEHDKLRRLLDEAVLWTGAWAGLPWPAAEIISLLERQKVFKEVMEHHDEREHHFLYSLLADATGPEEQAAMVAAFLSQAAVAFAAGSGGAEAARPASMIAGAAAAATAGCGWLAAILQSLAEGSLRGRRPASWQEALAACRRMKQAAEAAAGMAGGTNQAALALVPALQHGLAEVEKLAPLKALPIASVATAHSAVQVLGAALRAAQAAAGRGGS